MMAALDFPRPALAGRTISALAISLALHAAFLLSAPGQPDGGIALERRLNLPATVVSPIQLMLQAAGDVADFATATTEQPAPPPETFTPALITGSEALAGRNGLLPLGSTVRYYLAHELDVKPQIRTRINPAYPRAAAEQGVTAALTLRVFIDEQGRVERVLAQDRSAADPFAAAAVAAFQSASYTPGLKDGVAVKSLLQIEVNFEAADATETFRGGSY